MFITLTGIQGACIYINPEHIAAMPYTGGGKTPVYCATSGAHYQVLETPEQILALIEAERRKALRDEFAGKVAVLQSQLAASQERERILREGLEKYADENNWYEREDLAEDGALMGFTWEHHLNGPMHAQATLKAAEEVK